MQITKTANKITIEFTAIEGKILKDSLLAPLDWLETAITEKLANCKRRLISEWLTRLQQSEAVTSIPTKEADLLALIFSQPDYKNRAERDAERQLP